MSEDGVGISAGGADASATDKDGSHLVSSGLDADKSDRVGHDDDATRDAEGGVDQDSRGAGVAVAGRAPSAPASAAAAVRRVPAAPGSRPAVVPVLGRAVHGAASSVAPPVGVSGGVGGSAAAAASVALPVGVSGGVGGSAAAASSVAPPVGVSGGVGGSAAAASSVAPPVGVSGGVGGSAAAASSVAPPVGVSGGAGGSAASAEPVARFHGRRLHGPQSSYLKEFVQIPLKDIKVPMALTRLRRESDVEKFAMTFRATGYDWSRGLMTVDATSQVVDGFHRLGALHLLAKEGHPNAPETVFVCRVTRRDGVLLTRSDTLALGLSANKDTTPSVEMKPSDYVFWATTFVRAENEEMRAAGAVHRETARARGLAVDEESFAIEYPFMDGTYRHVGALQQSLLERGLFPSFGQSGASTVTMTRIVKLGLLSISSPRAVDFIRDCLCASEEAVATESAAKASRKGRGGKKRSGKVGKSSFSLESVSTGSLLKPATIPVVMWEPAQLAMLQIGWEYTGTLDDRGAYRRLGGGTDFSFFSALLVFLTVVMDEVEKVRQKRSVGEDAAGAGAGERAAPLPPACVMDLEASPFAVLDETPPRSTTTLFDQLRDLFLTYEVPMSSTGKAIRGQAKPSGVDDPFCIENRPAWRRLVRDFVDPSPPPPPAPPSPPPPPASSAPATPPPTAPTGAPSSPAAAGDGEGDKTGDDAPASGTEDHGEGGGSATVAAAGRSSRAARPTHSMNEDADTAATPPPEKPAATAGAASSAGQAAPADPVAAASAATKSSSAARRPTSRAARARPLAQRRLNLKPVAAFDGRAGEAARGKKRPLTLVPIAPKPKRTQPVPATRPYVDNPPRIAVGLEQQAKTNRRGLSSSMLGAKRVKMPAFATLLPVEHQSRDFLRFHDFADAASAAARALAAFGRSTASACAGAGGADEPAENPDNAGSSSGAGGTTSSAPGGHARSSAPDVTATPAASPAPPSSTLAFIGRYVAATQLHERGWTVLPFPTGVDRDGLQGLCDAPHHVLKYALDNYPGDEKVGVLAREKVAAAMATDTETVGALDALWGGIHNQDNGPVDHAALTTEGQGRLSVFSDALKSSKTRVEHNAFLDKLRTDLLMAAVAYEVLLGPWTRKDKSGQPEVRTPKTGARILLTTSTALRQSAHVDADVTPMIGQGTRASTMTSGGLPEAASNKQGGQAGSEVLTQLPRQATASPQASAAENPDDDDDTAADSELDEYDHPTAWSYFAMASGKDGFALVHWPGSCGVISRVSRASAKAIAQGLSYDDILKTVGTRLVPEIMFVPPHSFVLVRSDLVHAGAAAEDDSRRYGKALAELSYSHSIRHHLYLQHPRHHPLTDAIFLVSDQIFLPHRGAPVAEVQDVDAHVGGREASPDKMQVDAADDAEHDIDENDDGEEDDAEEIQPQSKRRKT